MKIVFFTDTHLAFHDNKNMIFNIFNECLQYAQSQHADLIIHTGDLFDIKHVNSQVIKKTIDILRKNSIRPLSVNEQLFPRDKDDMSSLLKIDQTEMKEQIPMVMICGNHEDKNLLKLLPVTVLDSQNTKDGVIHILPYIIRINSEILVLYGTDYIRNFEVIQEQSKLKFVPSVRFFKENVELLESHGISSLALFHQNCNKLTSLIKPDVFLQYNQNIAKDIEKCAERSKLIKFQEKLQLFYAINGHEHAYSEEPCVGDVLIIMPGSFTQTKRDNKLDNFINRQNRSLLLAELNNNKLVYEAKHIFLQQIAASYQINVQIDNDVYRQDVYLDLIYQEIDNMLKKCVTFYDYLLGNEKNPSLEQLKGDDELMRMLNFGFQYYLENSIKKKQIQNVNTSPQEVKYVNIRNIDNYTTALIEAIQEQDFTAFRYNLLPKPNIKLIVSVQNLNQHNYLNASSILLEDDLQKRYYNIFGNFNNRILHMHDVQQDTSTVVQNQEQQPTIQSNQQLKELLQNQQNNQFDEEYQIAEINFEKQVHLGKIIKQQLKSVCNQMDDDDIDPEEQETTTRNDRKNKKNNIEKQNKEELQKQINTIMQEFLKDVQDIENDNDFEEKINGLLNKYINTEGRSLGSQESSNSSDTVINITSDS